MRHSGISIYHVMPSRIQLVVYLLVPQICSAFLFILHRHRLFHFFKRFSQFFRIRLSSGYFRFSCFTLDGNCYIHLEQNRSYLYSILPPQTRMQTMSQYNYQVTVKRLLQYDYIKYRMFRPYNWPVDPKIHRNLQILHFFFLNLSSNLLVGA